MKEKLNNWKTLLLIIGVGIVVVLTLLILLVGKSEPELRLTSDMVTLEIGGTWQIPIEEKKGQKGPSVSYQSSNAAVASVSKDGEVKARREGTTQVTCTTEGGQRAVVKVTVEAGRIDRKVIYLTYEGGPSRDVTPELLTLLDEYDAKATFFPYGQEAEAFSEPIETAAEAGHTVGVYTYSDEYSLIYESATAYMEDFLQNEKILKSIMGKRPEYWRFPGGSVNEKLKDEDKKVLVDDLHRRGYVYVDWNCYIDDLSDVEHDAKTMAKTGIRTIDQAISMGQVPVVRMYDSSDNGQTLKVTRKLLKHYKKKGYRFRGMSSYEGLDIAAGLK